MKIADPLTIIEMVLAAPSDEEAMEVLLRRASSKLAIDPIAVLLLGINTHPGRIRCATIASALRSPELELRMRAIADGSLTNTRSPYEPVIELALARATLMLIEAKKESK